MPRGRATVVALSAWSVDPGGGHGDTTAVWGLVSLDVIRGQSVSWNSAGTARGSVVPVVWVGNECCGHLECSHLSVHFRLLPVTPIACWPCYSGRFPLLAAKPN